MKRKHPEAKPPFVQPKRGPDGRPRCRWCWGSCPKGRRTFCGDECVEEYRGLVDWNFVRRQVRKRDQGICAICDTDTVWLQSAMRAMRKEMSQEDCGHLMRALGFRTFNFHGQPYEVDHIKPRADGGDNQLANLRTLCCPCHKRVTAEFARVRAERKRADR